MMSWLTTQERRVILFVFTCLFVGIIVSWYFKLHPPGRNSRLSLEQKVLIHREPIDINTADFNDLLSIPGIGPVLAEAVLEYRKNYGPFKQKKELLHIKGIGQKKFKEITKRIILE